MKKFLQLFIAVLISTCAFANNNLIGKMDYALNHRSIAQGPISSHHITPAAAAQLKAANRQGPRRASIQYPAAQPKTYSMSGYFFTQAGMAYANGVAQQVSVEGDKVYFSNLFPILLEEREAWTVGQLNEDGTKISVPVQHVYDEDWYDVGTDIEFYMGDVVFNEEGDIVEVRPFEFCKQDDFIYMDDLTEVDEDGYAVVNHHIAIFAYSEAGETIDLYDYVAGHKLSPYDAGTLVECPSDARVEGYLYSALDDYGDPVKQVFQVAFSGNDVYFNGLTPDQPGWVHGTIGDDNIVTIPAGQYVGVQKYFYTYFGALTVAGRDPSGDANFHMAEALKLSFDPQTGIFTYVDPEVFIGELLYVGNNQKAVQAAYGEITISPLGEAKAATPSAPYEAYIMDLDDYGYEQWDFGFMLDLKGTEDEYLFPENLKVCMFMDDNLFTFDPENYMIDEPVTFIGYNDIDSNDAFYHNDNVFDFYVNKTYDFTRLGAVAIYTVNGETHYSDVVYVDLLTEEVSYEEITEAQLAQINGMQPDAIKHVKDNSQRASYFYNLQGQRVSNPAGIVICKNRKMLVK